MTSPSTDRRYGVVGSTAIKAPVACSTTANITLSGEQTIDGVLTAASRVLVMNQTDKTTNGIYDSTTGNWTRSIDFDGNYDILQGTTVLVLGGTQAGYWRVSSNDPITIGTTQINFERALVNDITTLSYTAPGTGGNTRAVNLKLGDFIATADYATTSEATIASSGILPILNTATGQFTVQGSLSSVKAAVAGYYRVTPNYCRISNIATYSTLASTQYNFAFTVTPPTTLATAMTMLFPVTAVASSLASGQCGLSVQAFNGVTLYDTDQFAVYRFVSTSLTSGTNIGYGQCRITVPISTSGTGVVTVSRLGSDVASGASYAIDGYFD